MSDSDKASEVKSAAVTEVADAEKVVPGYDAYEVDVAEGTIDTKIDVDSKLHDGLQRKMHQRHVQMIALAGTLGTGLFLGSGKAIRHAGPAGALIAYILVGTVVWGMIQSLAEMLCHAPISGGYIFYASRFLHPSAGFTLGWMQWYSAVISLPIEIISACVIIGFWDNDPVTGSVPRSHMIAYLTALSILCSAINYFGARWFGEAEFFFAIIKILLILGLIIAGLCVDLGGSPDHDRIGFRYWKDPGAFAAYPVAGNVGKFTGWFTTLLQAAFSFGGVEGIAMTAAEVQNPRANMRKAARLLFYRILFFYVCGIFIIGMLVPYNDSNLLNSSGDDASSSPFVIAFNRAGIKGLPSVINAGVLTSAFSAADSILYSASRMLYGLSLRGQAPKIFSKTLKNGLPIVALIVSNLFILLSYMTLSDGADTVLNWLSNLTSIATFICWGTICVSFLRFKAGSEAHGIDRKASKYFYNPYQPWPAYWAIFWCCIVVFFNGYQVFMKGGWSTSDFFIAYINIPIVLILFLGHWLYTGRPAFPKAGEIDMFSNVPGPEVDVDPNPPTTKMGKFFRWLL
ncbi:amino acid permease/ SLC12A domain-containing protein [Limtongia smithiae]|uniref:amino acid permease/ SLC12A domain-containing protein n=1 Tax=Limtongia smithiae TaxID=1125753 RepID=UPI0034CE5E32